MHRFDCDYYNLQSCDCGGQSDEEPCLCGTEFTCLARHHEEGS